MMMMVSFFWSPLPSNCLVYIWAGVNFGFLFLFYHLLSSFHCPDTSSINRWCLGIFFAFIYEELYLLSYTNTIFFCLNLTTIMAYISKQLESVSESNSELASGTVTPEAELKRSINMNAVNEALAIHDNEVNLSTHRFRGFVQSESSILSGAKVPFKTIAGSWFCCKCDGFANDALSPERCPLCPHFRCPYCRAA